eukprot:TRINITY_DN10582_c0_g1_i1.p1 TRINITY_DN10582_c0_g1~~TRINITY_DN10582_c0_g1_i1.p1  ORF type:complete len:173 (-),score=35.67 TRINITY_DN10582_c0_g1_i1:59-577(-)
MGKKDNKDEKVNVYDANAVKQLFDDNVIEVVKKNGKQISEQITNIKFGLGIFGCSLAAISHFFPVPFPENIPLLIVCVVLYFITSAALQYITDYKEKDIILTTVPDNGVSFQIGTDVVTKENNYEMRLYINGESIVHSHHIGKYFTEEATFLKEIFHNDVSILLLDTKEKRN